LVGCIFPGNLGGDRDTLVDVLPADAETGADTGADHTVTSDAAQHFNLYVTMQGFESENGLQHHVLCIDPTTSRTCASGGGGPVGNGGFPEQLGSNTIEAGSTYNYDYWFDTSGYTQFGLLNPEHYVHSFGPVTGDTHVVLTPMDIFVSN
jgi:hypothetical protein